jgi:hypothetical protein
MQQISLIVSDTHSIRNARNTVSWTSNLPFLLWRRVGIHLCRCRQIFSRQSPVYVHYNGYFDWLWTCLSLKLAFAISLPGIDLFVSSNKLTDLPIIPSLMNFEPTCSCLHAQRERLSKSTDEVRRSKCWSLKWSRSARCMVSSSGCDCMALWILQTVQTYLAVRRMRTCSQCRQPNYISIHRTQSWTWCDSFQMLGKCTYSVFKVRNNYLGSWSTES